MDLVVGRLTANAGGFGFVVPEHARPGERKDVYIAAANLTEAMHGDRVVARVERKTEKGLEGRIIRILERSQQTVVGRFDVDPSGLGYVTPFDRRVDALDQAGLHSLTADTSGLTGVIVHLGPLGGAQGAGPLLGVWALVYVAIVLTATAVGLTRRDL